MNIELRRIESTIRMYSCLILSALNKGTASTIFLILALSCVLEYIYYCLKTIKD